jgi:hypothetical protein
VSWKEEEDTRLIEAVQKKALPASRLQLRWSIDRVCTVSPTFLDVLDPENRKKQVRTAEEDAKLIER